MSDFVSGFWSPYITVMVLVSVIGCGVFLWLQGRARHVSGQTMGHVWDETLEEYNNPLPNWWRWMFFLTVFFALGYLAMYPGLGSYRGQFGWSSQGQYDQEMAAADATYGKIFDAYLKQDLKTVAADPKAREMGQRLFLNYCAQCHGSDAKGGKGFPNLTDKDWLWGGTPDKIEETILGGRNGIMPPFAALGPEPIKDLANYVRSLSGLKHDPVRAGRGQQLFASSGCTACHGTDAHGNQMLGAPNLTDKIWLFGSSEATIVETITQGRNLTMPAQKDFLGPAKVHLLAAFVYGSGGGVDAPPTPVTQ